MQLGGEVGLDADQAGEQAVAEEVLVAGDDRGVDLSRAHTQRKEELARLLAEGEGLGELPLTVSPLQSHPWKKEKGGAFGQFAVGQLEGDLVRPIVDAGAGGPGEIEGDGGV